VDDRVQPQDAARVAQAITPDYALGGHTASLGLCWMPRGTLPGFDEDGWSSASTAPGTAASSAATGWCSCHSRTAARPGKRHAMS
jgi:hypothetical protein